MEASGSAHYWARVLTGSGHIVKLMAPQFVKPYVKSNKNDANDAEAICEAVTRPSELISFGQGGGASLAGAGSAGRQHVELRAEHQTSAYLASECYADQDYRCLI